MANEAPRPADEVLRKAEDIVERRLDRYAARSTKRSFFLLLAALLAVGTVSALFLQQFRSINTKLDSLERRPPERVVGAPNSAP